MAPRGRVVAWRVPETSISFERAADYYDETRGYPDGLAPTIASEIAVAGRCKGDELLLEIGVGTGRVALPVAEHVRRVVGVDLAESMLRKLVAKRANRSVDAVRADLLQLPFADDHFDVALSLHVLHLVADWQAALRELARVMSPHGLYVQASDGRRLRVLWDEVNARLPTLQLDLGATHMPTDFPILGGFAAAGPERRLHYTQMTHVPTVLDQLRRRVWSATWTMSDRALGELVTTFEQVVQERYGCIPHALEDTRTFTVRVYRPDR